MILCWFGISEVGDVQRAVRVFNSFKDLSVAHNVLSYNCIIHAHAHASIRSPRQAEAWFKRLHRDRFSPTTESYNGVIASHVGDPLQAVD